MRKIQRTITLVIEAEYDETKTNEEWASDEMCYLAVRPNFGTVSNGVHLTQVTLMEDGELILTEDEHGFNHN